MIKYEGKLLKLGSIDKCGRMWSKDCKISFPEKVPILYNFCYNVPPLGFAEIYRDEDGLGCKISFIDFPFSLDEELHIGGFYGVVEKHEEDSIHVITSCRLISVSIIPEEEVADPDLKIRRVDEHD